MRTEDMIDQLCKENGLSTLDDIRPAPKKPKDAPRQVPGSDLIDSALEPGEPNQPYADVPVMKLYDADDNLLYVTRSTQLQNLIKFQWFRTTRRISVDWYVTAGQAEDAKLVAIDRENPRWNKIKTR